MESVSRELGDGNGLPITETKKRTEAKLQFSFLFLQFSEHYFCCKKFNKS
ncbi:hypothetical protein O59_000943 [Cellvibrio sp. BR]|nr:hypothetical protein O59_000943 [Cellvibrio sp. BR]